MELWASIISTAGTSADHGDLLTIMTRSLVVPRRGRDPAYVCTVSFLSFDPYDVFSCGYEYKSTAVDSTLAVVGSRGIVYLLRIYIVALQRKQPSGSPAPVALSYVTKGKSAGCFLSIQV